MKRVALGLITLLASSLAWSQSNATAKALHWLEANEPVLLQKNPLTDNISHLRWDAAPEVSGRDVREKAQNLISTLGPAIGLKSDVSSLQLLSVKEDLAGNSHLKFQHYHAGIPVFDGYLQFHFDKQERLKGLDGILLKDIGTMPELIASEQAFAQAQMWLRKHYGAAVLASVEVEEETLNWFAEGLVQGRKGPIRLVYVLTLTNRANIREQIIIDAEDGRIIDHYSDVCELAHRQLFSGNTNSTPIWQDGDAFPAALSVWQQTQVQTAEEVYNLFHNTFGVESYDDDGGDMLMVDQAAFLNCPNASWNGYSTNYCNAISTDDVVGHEWGHAYSEYTNHLLFAWQAGAINEGFSDIWGETIDLLNSPIVDKALRAECGDSDRWLIAEGTAVFDDPIRDMWNPNCTDNPGRVGDAFYQCSSEDHGGVHINSTVVSHAYALLVDGGAYNDYTINGIGLTKAAHLFWQAQAHYLSRTSDFPALADALSAAYLDLRDVPLPELSLANDYTPVYQYLTSGDSLSLQNAIAAVELKVSPGCENFMAVLEPGTPEICLENDQVLTPFFTEDFETGTDGWTLSAHPGTPASWVPRHWVLKEELPNNRQGTAAFATNPAVGHCDTMPNDGSLRLKTPLIDIPVDVEGNIYLVFDHYFSIEEGVDGANVKLQQNNGSWLRIPPMAFLHNGYNSILPQSDETDNPLAGDRVWTGADIGSTTGSWGTTQINLSVLGVEAGESIRLRWELGTDGCDGWDGWYVDDIHVGSCALAALPVEWLGFDATLEKGKVLLDWQTTQEEDNKGFYIERSIDGRDFTELGFVPAATSAPFALNNYSFIDDALPFAVSTWYYRLRQVDLDGTTAYSPLRSVERKNTAEWYVSPNPAQDNTVVIWPDAPFEQASVYLRQAQGKLVAHIPSWSPDQPLELALDSYPPGLYLVQVLAGDKRYSQRLIIQ